MDGLSQCLASTKNATPPRRSRFAPDSRLFENLLNTNILNIVNIKNNINSINMFDMVPIITPIMENQMEKKMENEMEAAIT